jgi:hypothetical protein
VNRPFAIFGGVAFVASAAYVATTPVALQPALAVALILASLAAVVLPLRTGPFLFLAMWGVALFVVQKSGELKGGDREAIAPVLLSALYLLAACEGLFLRFGHRPAARPFEPVFGGIEGGHLAVGLLWRTALYGGLAWALLQAGTEWSPAAFRRPGTPDLVRLGVYVWVIAAFFVAMRLVRRTVATAVADRRTAWALALDTAWRWLRSPFGIVARERWRG